MTSERALSTVKKLLRVAAPNSGASDNERTSAARQACALISEHNFVVVTHEKKNTEPRGPRMSDIVNVVINVANAAAARPSAFRRSVAAHDTTCGVETCTLPIFEGETVWRRYKDGQVEYVHADCWTR